MLTGGTSTRMGTDKAVLVVDGTAMARRVADALQAGGATEVVGVGGDAGALGALGLTVIADEHPGEGPLGGLFTALHEAQRRGAAVVALAGCDLPDLDGPTVATLLAALDGSAPEVVVAVAIDEDGRRPLLLALRVDPAEAAVAAVFAAGSRSVRSFVDQVPVVEVRGLPSRALRDVDQPTDLDKR